MTKKENISIEDFFNQYSNIVSLLDDFRIELVKEISKVLEEGGIQLGFPISSRTKSFESIEEKLIRIDTKFNKIEEIQDLVGIRIILLFNKDVEKVCKLLEEYLSSAKRYDAKDRLGESEFGYSSIHFVIKISEEWLKVPSFEKFRNLKAEIQIRTFAQHLWAEASHQLQYKSQENIPKEIKRAVFRVSAVLELTDLELERVLLQKEQYRENVKEQKMSDFDDLELNVDVLEELLNKSYPSINKKEEGENFSLLLDVLKSAGIHTTVKLKKLIDKHLEEAIEYDKDRAKKIRKIIERRTEITGITKERADKGVYYNFIGLTNWMLRQEGLIK